MKAAVFYQEKKLRIEDIPIPEPQEGEVLIKVMACGICGTDVHIFNGDEGAAATPAGTVLGHEFSGVVEKLGANVKGLSVGDKVCVDPNKLCDECYYCKKGIGHFCESMIGIGTTVNGGFAEYCCVPQSQVYKVSEKTSFEKAAMAEPVACCLHGIDMCDIKVGETVLIIGGGMIGLIMLQLSKLSGAGRLILLEPVAEKRVLGYKLGADLCIDPIHENVEEILSEKGIGRISTVIECAGLPSTMSQAIYLAGKKSTVMLFGLTKPNDEIPVKPFEIFKKEIVIKASFINPYTQQRAVDLIDSGKIDVSSMVYKKISLDELSSVLSDSVLRSKGKIIVVNE